MSLDIFQRQFKLYITKRKHDQISSSLELENEMLYDDMKPKLKQLKDSSLETNKEADSSIDSKGQKACD